MLPLFSFYYPEEQCAFLFFRFEASTCFMTLRFGRISHNSAYILGSCLSRVLFLLDTNALWLVSEQKRKEKKKKERKKKCLLVIYHLKSFLSLGVMIFTAAEMTPFFTFVLHHSILSRFGIFFFFRFWMYISVTSATPEFFCI